MLNKILALLALQHSSSNSLLFQQLLVGVGAVIFLSLTTAFLTSVLIAGAVCLGYNLLVSYGLNEHAAMFALGILLLIILLITACTAGYYARKIKQISKQLLAIENPIASRVSNLVSAFIDGFNGRRSRS